MSEGMVGGEGEKGRRVDWLVEGVLMPVLGVS